MVKNELYVMIFVTSAFSIQTAKFPSGFEGDGAVNLLVYLVKHVGYLNR